MYLRLLGLCLLLGLVSCSRALGTYYLEREHYEQGVRHFQQEVQAHPDDPTANYYLGRLYLAQERPEEALPLLRRAAASRPGEPDYHFWLGVAYWGVLDFKQERQSYERALALDSDHLPARVYLGHNLLDRGEWNRALARYQEVLARDPGNPEALYNRGLALRNLRQPTREAHAWREYLRYYPQGRWALRAADHLNDLGDFSYRNFTIGYRRVTLERIPFTPGSTELRAQGSQSLDVVGNILAVNQGIELGIVGYVSKNGVLAEARAAVVRDYLLKRFPAIRPSRLTSRGEGNPEAVKTENGMHDVDESIAFVTIRK